MAFCMEWALIPLLNNWTAVQMMLQRKFKALKGLLVELLPGFKMLSHLADKKGEVNLLLRNYSSKLNLFLESCSIDYNFTANT